MQQANNHSNQHSHPQRTKQNTNQIHSFQDHNLHSRFKQRNLPLNTTSHHQLCKHQTTRPTRARLRRHSTLHYESHGRVLSTFSSGIRLFHISRPSTNSNRIISSCNFPRPTQPRPLNKTSSNSNRSLHVLILYLHLSTRIQRTQPYNNLPTKQNNSAHVISGSGFWGTTQYGVPTLAQLPAEPAEWSTESPVVLPGC